ncbi:MAG TPA: glycosyltransferase family 2 protein [Tepidisphaeraceae bacterium]|nr:glycosyltransferase family 2 protein [Tepidisphaeraceae bacterium]
MIVSAVVPVFNEQENLPELHRRLAAALEATGHDWEVVFVDDGSADDTPAIIRRFHREDGRFKLIELSRNFGHQPAITAGIHHATGDCVVLIDGDLQDPPEVIPQMVAKWEDGYHVVLGERRSRADAAGLRGLGFRLFYPVLHRLSDLPQGPDAGVFGLMDRAVVDEFNKLPERNRFIPGLRSWLGFKQTGVPYDRNDRAAGKPKQTLRRLIHYAMDGIFSFSYKPLRAATYLGLAASTVSFLLAMFYFVTFFAFHKQAGSGFTTIILCVLFLGGVQLICVGILGEYVGRIYEEIKQRPLYVVKDRVGVVERERELAADLRGSPRI